MINEKTALKRLGRILSVDPRIERVAFAFFKDSGLSDCGVKTFREEDLSSRAKRLIIPFLVQALDKFNPHAILIPETKPIGARRRSQYATGAIKALMREALKRGIAVHVINSETVKNSFKQSNGDPAKNKEHIHKSIVERFPELTVMMPRPRLGVFEPERYYTPLFNAVAMYIAWQDQQLPTYGTSKGAVVAKVR